MIPASGKNELLEQVRSESHQKTFMELQARNYDGSDQATQMGVEGDGEVQDVL